MNELEIQAFILGILQGLTEFLPISSSAHLLILPWLLGWAPLGLTFDVILHAGTLLAVLIYFRSEVRDLVLELASFTGSSRPQHSLLRPVLAGSVPALLAAWFFRGLIEQHVRTPWVVVITLAGIGFLLLWADRQTTGARSWHSLSWRDGLLIGTAQALALIPGVSRSGITIIAALLLGFSRADSARFSFILAIPLISAATAAGILELFLIPARELPLVPLAIGVVSSFVSGFLCIKYFLRFLQTSSFLSFAVYRLCLSAFICWWLLF